MHRRYEHINIPIEVVRTIVMIVECGSYSKAGERLGLSQPAISAQIRRFQILIGAPVFEKVSGGVGLTERGKLVLAHARRLLDANDQILSLGAGVRDHNNIRLGLSTLYAGEFLLAAKGQVGLERIHINADMSEQLIKSFDDGYLDIVCVLNPPAEGRVVDEWHEEWVWTRSRDFVVSPGAPIPLIAAPSTLQPITRELEKAGCAYRVAFSSADHQSRTAAAVAGLGLLALPARQACDPLIIARDYYLPPIPAMRAGICIRSSIEMTNVSDIVEVLKGLNARRESGLQVMNSKS